MTYRKFHCMGCDNQFTSNARIPRCSKCGTRKVNEITVLDAERIVKPQPKPVEKTKEQPEEEQEEKPENDGWGGLEW